MAKLGMDTAQVTSDGNAMKQIGDSGLPELVSQVESIVNQMHGDWQGADSDAFLNAWNGTYKPQLTNIAQNLSTHGQLAVTNASDQDTASGAGTASV